MAYIEIFYTWGGQCGSGTSNYFRILRDGVQIDVGTTQISCSADGENTLRDFTLSRSGATALDVVYINGVLYQSGGGSISFLSAPEGAEIFLDGTDQGVRTPYTITNVPSGEHTYTLKLAGYNDASGSITAVGGSTVQVSATLFIPKLIPSSRAITITNNGPDLTDFQVSFTLDTAALIRAGKMRSLGEDIRVTDSDKTTLLPFWVESINTATTKIWVKVPLIKTGTKTIYMYYGNPNATDAQNGANTFVFFDDFSSGVIDTAKWNTTGSPGISNGILTIPAGSRLQSNTSFTNPLVLEFRSSYISTGGFSTSIHQGLVSSNERILHYADRNGANLVQISKAGIITDVNTNYLNNYQVRKIIWDSSKPIVRWYANDIESSGSSSVSSSYIPIGSMSLLFQTSGEYGSISLDYVFIRKFTSAEPIASVGEEISPSAGIISLSSVPDGAEIFLDGIDQGVKTPNIITNVPAGTHTYSLKLSGYTDYTGTVEVLENQTSSISAAFTPQEGCVNVNTTPAGARIFIDNVDTGKVTPSMICGLSLGQHTFKLMLDGYVEETGSVSLGSGQGEVISKVPVPLPAITTGSLDISSIPIGADIFIDGGDIGIKTPATITNLPAGSHAYRLALSGYSDATGTFTITAGQTAQVSATLIQKGVGAGAIIGLGLLGAGIMGAVILNSGQKNQQGGR